MSDEEKPAFSRHIGETECTNQGLIDELDGLMDLVVAGKAATQAGDMLARFTSRHPDKELARTSLEESKRRFNEQIDRGLEALG